VSVASGGNCEITVWSVSALSKSRGGTSVDCGDKVDGDCGGPSVAAFDGSAAELGMIRELRMNTNAEGGFGTHPGQVSSAVGRR
jgi:hypothetical protein